MITNLHCANCYRAHRLEHFGWMSRQQFRGDVLRAVRSAPPSCGHWPESARGDSSTDRSTRWSPPDVVVRWLNRLMKFDNSDPLVSFAVMQLARKTGDRYRDIDETTRHSVLSWMDRTQTAKRHRELVREVGALETEDQSLLFGEALPKGLRIA